MTNPTVSVVTATWGRPRTILGAIASVAAQEYDNIEHLIVTDGFDRELNAVLYDAGYFEDGRGKRLACLGRNWTQVHGTAGCGATARQAGCLLARGDWIAYLDDDDEWLPDHLSRMVACGEENQADLVTCPWQNGRGGVVNGASPPRHGSVGTSMMMHRPSLLKISGWQPDDGYPVDGRLCERWVAGGARLAWQPDATAILNGHRFGEPDEPDRP